MRVGVFHTTLPEPGRKVGGVEVFVHRLANHLADREHDVRMYSLAVQPPSDARYSMRRIGHPMLASRIARLAICPIVLNRVDWSGLDVLSLHGDDWFFVNRPLPTVRSFHGSALYEATSATSLQRKLSQFMVYPGELLSSRLADASYTSAAEMPSAYRLDGRLVLAIEPLTDHAGSTVAKSPRPSVLFVGTWDGRKRGRFLRDAFVRDVLPSVPDAELWMVSDHCEEGPSVRWIRFPSDRELGELYEQAWLFCLPSTYEGFGMPYVEAMAHGAAVVASPNSGAIWATDSGRAGAVVADHSLGDAIRALLTDPEARWAYVAAGAARARDFTWERACDEHERAFRGAIAAFQQRRSARRS